MGDMQGRSILVTGAASGIGQATAELLAASGAAVTVADRSADAGEAVVQGIRASGGKAAFVRVDVTDPREVDNMVAEAQRLFGRLHGAVNAAGLGAFGKPFVDLTLDDIDRSLAVNYRGVFLCMKSQIAAMLPHGGGSIVVIASTAATHGFQLCAEYCGSKSGVMGLVRGAAADYATSGLRVNGVLPGPTLTPMLQAVMDANEETRAICEGGQAMRRIAQPVEIAGAARWLLSDDSSYTTGIALAVDGGGSYLRTAG